MAMRGPSSSSSLSQRARTYYDQWLLRTRVLTRDSWSLLKSAVVSSYQPYYHDFMSKLKFGAAASSSSPPLSSLQQQERQQQRRLSWKELLLNQANPPHYNAMAIKLLVAEKEMTLLRYHGMQTYARQKYEQQRQRRLQQQQQQQLQEGNDNDDDSYSNSNNSTTESSSSSPLAAGPKESQQQQEQQIVETITAQENSGGAVARIAFMITASMKQELISTLGYTEQDIKRLNPLQASLVLHHKVQVQNVQDRLPILLQQYQEELQRQHLQEQQRQQDEEERRRIAQSMELVNQVKEEELIQMQQEQQEQQQQTAEAEATLQATKEGMGTSTATTTTPQPDGTSGAENYKPSSSSSSSSSSFFNFSSWQSQNELLDKKTTEKTTSSSSTISNKTRTSDSLSLSSVDDRDGSTTTNTTTAKNKWFELVQVTKRQPATNGNRDGGDIGKSNPKAEEGHEETSDVTVLQVVALHKTLEEAQFDLETRQEFANRRRQQQQEKLNGGSSSKQQKQVATTTMEYQIRETTR